MKRRMPLERPHVGWKQAKANGAAAVAVVDAVDERRQLLAPVIVGREQIRLVLDGGHQTVDVSMLTLCPSDCSLPDLGRRCKASHSRSQPKRAPARSAAISSLISNARCVSSSRP